jgi:putative endonuclease
MWSVYAVEGDGGDFLYVGMSEDVPKRVRAHQSGKVRSTKGHRPLRLVFVEYVGPIDKAREREKFLKSTAGKRWLKARVRGSPPDRE